MKKFWTLLLCMLCAFSCACGAQQALPDGAYALGDDVRQTMLALTDETSVSLADILAGKEAAVVCFFPVFDETYIQHLAEIQAAILQTGAQMQLIALFNEDQAVDFDALKAEDGFIEVKFGRHDETLALKFGVGEDMHMVIIDRFGTLCSSLPAENAVQAQYESLFALYTGDGYAQSVLTHELPVAEAMYKIIFTDENGNPAEGVMAQICDASTCLVLFSDANGEVSFSNVPYAYEVHVLMAPEGYAANDGVYTMPENGGTIEIVLARE